MTFRNKHLLNFFAFAVTLTASQLVADDMREELGNNSSQHVQFSKNIASTARTIEAMSQQVDTLLAETDQKLERLHDVDVQSKRNLFASNTRDSLSQASYARAQKKSSLDPEAGKKELISIERGDSKLTVGGKTKIEHFFKKNASLLNTTLPDEAEYFKHTVDVIFDYVYGSKKHGHDAVHAYVDLRHKGIWGLGSVFADGDTTQPTKVQVADSLLGSHSHANGKPLVWIKDAWLEFSLNAVANSSSKNIHTLKLGWFSFDLGRGISLGSFYGLNREALGLYSYPEDKSAPGILLSGDLYKDYLSYDFYYSKFEERGKSLRYTLNLDKLQHVDRRANPYRGVGKDDEVFAAQVTWQALKDSKAGSLVLKPYVMYNEASDQTVEVAYDTKTELGTIGLNAEHVWGNFEMGGEIAFNFGNEILKAIDRNHTGIRNKNGNIEEVYSHILNIVDMDKARVTSASKEAAKQNVSTNGAVIKFGTEDLFVSAQDRFRPFFKNKLSGWMTVVDAAYKVNPLNTKFAVAWGYSSGDGNPHEDETSKAYKEFIGLHESYSGKRVKSFIVLDDRLIQVPGTLREGDDNVSQDFAFSDLQHFGLSADYNYACKSGRKLSVNPNLLFFWKVEPSKKFDINATKIVDGKTITGVATEENARKYMGMEFNILARVELLKDLHLFGNFGVFVPGGFFCDIAGVPLKSDYFNSLAKVSNLTGQEDAFTYRISNDTAYYSNIGFEYKF